MRKPLKSKAGWQGKVVGAYLSGDEIGYNVSSEFHKGSIQLYAESQLEAVPEEE